MIHLKIIAVVLLTWVVIAYAGLDDRVYQEKQSNSYLAQKDYDAKKKLREADRLTAQELKAITSEKK